MPTQEHDLQKDLPKDDEQVAVIHTNYGDIVLRFFPEEAPKSVENFVELAKKGYYNGIKFHRVIENFMIQGGDPSGNGTGGESIWGAAFKDEFSPYVANKRGSISMANAGPNTNGSQFFINQADNGFLDGKHSVFGEVVKGMKEIDKIAQVKKNANDAPVEPVVMETVEITTWGEVK